MNYNDKQSKTGFWNWGQFFQNRESTLKVWIKTRDDSAIYRLKLCHVNIRWLASNNKSWNHVHFFTKYISEKEKKNTYP